MRTSISYIAIIAAALIAPAATGGEEPTPERTLAYSRSGRTYGVAHYYPPRERAQGDAKIAFREVRSKFRMLTLGAEVDLDVRQAYFAKPGTSRVMGFAVRQTTAEIVQFTEGALVPASALPKGSAEGLRGLMMRVTRNGEVVMNKVLPVPAETIIPVDMSFVPGLVRRAGGKGGTAAIFAVETLSLVQMHITPAGTEKIEIGGRKVDAERYNVVSAAKGTPAPLRKRHTLYYEPGTTKLLVSIEDDPGRKQRTRVENARRSVEGSLRRLRQRGDPLRPRRLPWPAGWTETYVVKRDGVAAGSVEVRIEGAPGGLQRLLSKRALGSDTEEATALITAEGFGRSYAVEGSARLMKPTGEIEKRSYSVDVDVAPSKITHILAAGAKRREKSRPLDGKVFLLDRNAPGLFAIIASQLELKLGFSANVPVYHCRDGEAAVLSFTVGSSGEGPDGPYFVVYVRGRSWYGTMTVGGDGRLIRADRIVGGSATFEYIRKRK